MTNNQQPEIAKLFQKIRADIADFTRGLDEAEQRVIAAGLATVGSANTLHNRAIAAAYLKKAETDPKMRRALINLIADRLNESERVTNAQRTLTSPTITGA